MYDKNGTNLNKTELSVRCFSANRDFSGYRLMRFEGSPKGVEFPKSILFAEKNESQIDNLNLTRSPGSSFQFWRHNWSSFPCDTLHDPNQPPYCPICFCDSCNEIAMI